MSLTESKSRYNFKYKKKNHFEFVPIKKVFFLLINKVNLINIISIFIKFTN